MGTDEVTARGRQLAWIHAILTFRRWTPTRLAREAHISQSTLAKFLGDPLDSAHLSLRSVEKIAQVAPLSPYQTEPGHQVRGFAEDEAQRFETAEDDDPANRAIAAAKAGRAHVDPWVLRAHSLEAAGFLPGDVLLVDLNERANDGDVVCAQVYDRSGNAETVFRILDRPFLVAATLDRRPMKPLLVDNEHIVIRGVVVAAVRFRTVTSVK